jgi:hypothetical protein
MGAKVPQPAPNRPINNDSGTRAAVGGSEGQRSYNGSAGVCRPLSSPPSPPPPPPPPKK